MDPGEYVGEAVYPLLRDIATMLRGYTSIVVRHVYHEANSAADWIATYVVEHSGENLWTDMREASGHFRDFLFSDFLGCNRTCSV